MQPIKTSPLMILITMLFLALTASTLPTELHQRNNPVNHISVPVPNYKRADRATEKAQAKQQKADNKALQSGIKDNIHVQKDELKSLKGVGKAESKNGDNPNFQGAKDKLNGNIDKGVDIRKSNQALAKSAGNTKVQPGLDKVAHAQAGEKQLASGLTGKKSEDKQDLKTLNGDFKGGIAQNKQNLKDAKAGAKQGH